MILIFETYSSYRSSHGFGFHYFMDHFNCLLEMPYDYVVFTIRNAMIAFLDNKFKNADLKSRFLSHCCYKASFRNMAVVSIVKKETIISESDIFSLP